MSTSKWKKFAACFDLHGDKQDEATVKKFLKFLEDWKPQVRIFGGDLWDFRPLRKGASEEERAESMSSDYVAGVNFLKAYRPDYFIRGNHDERLWELAENGKGVTGDYAYGATREIDQLMEQLNCTMLPYHKRHGVLKLGHLKILHGFNSGVYAARQTALVYGSCLFGHIHSIDEFSIPGLERRVARACGALCSLDMEYNARQPGTLRQANGWAYGVINDKTGEFHVFQAEEVGGSFVVSTDMKTL